MSDKILSDDDRWRIALEKDWRYDGVFVTGVHSTGIYCRPSCPARAPKRENVRFYTDPQSAEAAGLRPCKRCAPDSQSREEVAIMQTVELLRHAQQPVSLEQLGAATGFSPSHLQRIFTRAVGMSPSAYYRAERVNRAKRSLGEAGRVTDAIYDAGFEAPSRFYAALEGKLGMTASEWKNGGAGKIIHYTTIGTTLGPVLIAATDIGVCGVSFGESEADLRLRFPNAVLREGSKDFRVLFEQVAASIENPAGAASARIPLDVRGTAFQQRVWQALREIPPGETRSYGQLAAALGSPKASRAVGGANGANDVAVLIPCHRVIAADGSLGGYAYGLEIKRELLRREKEAR